MAAEVRERCIPIEGSADFFTLNAIWNLFVGEFIRLISNGQLRRFTGKAGGVGKPAFCHVGFKVKFKVKPIFEKIHFIYSGHFNQSVTYVSHYIEKM